jgi:hypothetical protein
MDVLIAVGLVLYYIVRTASKKKALPKAKPPAAPQREQRSQQQDMSVGLPPSPPRPWPAQQRREEVPPQKRKLGFDVPHLKGAPPVAAEAAGAEERRADRLETVPATAPDKRSAYDATRRQAETAKAVQHHVRYDLQRHLTEAAERVKEEAAYEKAEQPAQPPQAPSSLPPLEPAAMLQAVVYAEMLGRPKGMRSGNPYYRG